ncbi:hypothetical protein PP175_28195 (plasmid) [Aneurinibacillus sp. Ricciae_BoGa-3]|uniref:hypothetical protein n=1 Tax=Aneurinibacillus sp. Ricciae_BoGa-3 TaxID=3022697 RepID=UPI00233F9392|nr:hypothetical protein [Aneurinibacillus sp. Ricciae_BoGa-3]WCK57072.1 hypothetical protein PP175_28195 [Aneurinibacillus sp. Ricciae_BoGa-3]
MFHCKDIEQQTDISVFIENRSNEKIWLSNPEEIIEFSTKHLMTIDFAQLFISCGFNQDVFRRTLEKIQWRNIKELHVANIKRDGNRTYVARKLDDGMLRLQDLTSHFEYVPYATLEILGGVPTFEDQVEQLRSYFREGC